MFYLIYEMSWKNVIKGETCQAFYCFLAMSLINPMMQKHTLDSFLSYDIKITLKSHFWLKKNVIIYAAWLSTLFHACCVTGKSVNH